MEALGVWVVVELEAAAMGWIVADGLEYSRGVGD